MRSALMRRTGGERKYRQEARAFQIETRDNVATALTVIPAGKLRLLGNTEESELEALEEIPLGHKIALCNIAEGDMIVKYGVPIGKATTHIKKGGWVHLHCMRSNYDERSSHLDIYTGAPADIDYEV